MAAEPGLSLSNEVTLVDRLLLSYMPRQVLHRTVLLSRQTDREQEGRRLITVSTMPGTGARQAVTAFPRSPSQPVVLRSEAPAAVSLVQYHQPAVDRLEQLQGLTLCILYTANRRDQRWRVRGEGSEVEGSEMEGEK